MKTYIFSSLLVMIMLFNTTNTKAQDLDRNKNNYVVLTKKVPQLQPIILTAQALKAEEGDKFGDFQVIICGPLIGEITDTEKMGNFIEQAQKFKVQLLACGFSLDKFKVDRTKIPREIRIVENGILHNFQLQNKGYKSVSL
ncbi:sulfur reduction protein DsrE [Maribacter ulvicola]|uniref:DsrE/DsrF-like family protein n=1 Tax=Maribacter ulvicola TaxID=228959 RepID=A0A1N6Z7Q2_9FLAO|nr:sulfur reduction protein DsrE [Maribacter ulvicola]SIR22809.1 hypothetical protein SAMN05421797_10868 [Maribacter ulvicola]